MAWHGFDTLIEAQACLDYINSNDAFPIIGQNYKTGKPAYDKQKTLRWHRKVVECTDGKFRIPEPALDRMGISQEESKIFLTTFNSTIEIFNPSWIPQEIDD